VTKQHLAPRDLALNLAIVALLGFSFVPIKVGLREIPPFALAALRFFFAAMPMVFFVRRPQIPWRYIAAYGFAIGVCQFGLLFLGLKLGIPAGLSSLVIQVQVFFTIGPAIAFLGDRLQRHHLVGAVIAAVGIVLLAADQLASGATVTLIGFALVIVAAFAWSVGNVVAKRAAGRRAIGVRRSYRERLWVAAAGLVSARERTVSAARLPAIAGRLAASGDVLGALVGKCKCAAGVAGLQARRRCAHRVSGRGQIGQRQCVVAVQAGAGIDPATAERRRRISAAFSEVAFHLPGNGEQRRLRVGPPSLLHLIDVARVRDRRQYRHYDADDHHLDQGKAARTQGGVVHVSRCRSPRRADARDRPDPS
jgi:drug/metabolite transporter (DMT)-like permease